ncbi:MAG: ribonuclease HII [Bacteroidales bacterium]
MALKQYYNKGVVEAGCDEAGRGCLAGPVFAAAVIFPKDYDNQDVNDSKKLKAGKRDQLCKQIEEDALTYAVSRVDAEEIDELNIFRASIVAMHRAIAKLSIDPDHLLIDGKYFYSYKSFSHTCVIKGDSKFLSIAAASILAKTYRDAFMIKLHEDYPEYQWHSNKGYPTRHHREAIKIHGITPYHRNSFRLLPEAYQVKLDI